MAKFLLIDDDPDILRLLSELISRSFPDCEVYSSETGRGGLDIAEARSPDVILLDIRLPDMGGVEVCAKLKSSESTRDIPVILVTASQKESQDIINGLETGADYCLNKPFDTGHLIAHIKASLRIKQTEDLLRRQKQELEKLFEKQTADLLHSRELLAEKVQELQKQVEGQTQELIRADRLAAMGILSAGIAHEINNPTTFIRSNLQTFRMFWEEALKFIDGAKAPDQEQLTRIDFVRQEMPGLIKGMEEGCSRITAIVQGMKNYIADDNAESRVVDLKEVADSALRLTHNQIKHDIEVEVNFAENMPRVLGSEQLLHQVMVNLILNAANVMREYRGEGKLVISGFGSDGQAVIAVKDNGPGMTRETLDNLFNPFFTMRRGHGGTGLGLFVSHGIIKGHNGLIEVETELAKGTTFNVKLPAIEKEQSLAVEVE
jgi:two-component system, NtrC family, sensor kinase